MTGVDEDTAAARADGTRSPLSSTDETAISLSASTALVLVPPAAPGAGDANGASGAAKSAANGEDATGRAGQEHDADANADPMDTAASNAADWAVGSGGAAEQPGDGAVSATQAAGAAALARANGNGFGQSSGGGSILGRSFLGGGAPTSPPPSCPLQGVVGLNNLGNTCYMNASLQCLAHTFELHKYFTSGAWKSELNVDNPIGSGGKVATEFAALMRQMWADAPPFAIAPRDFKWTLAQCASQFAGYGQQDAQELMSFLVQTLDEDLNRVTKKPYVEIKDSAGRPDEAVAAEQLAGHRLRNQSIVQDLMAGQYKSHLVCSACGHSNTTFDAYLLLNPEVRSAATSTMEVTLTLVRAGAGAGEEQRRLSEAGLDPDLAESAAALAEQADCEMAAADGEGGGAPAAEPSATPALPREPELLAIAADACAADGLSSVHTLTLRQGASAAELLEALAKAAELPCCRTVSAEGARPMPWEAPTARLVLTEIFQSKVYKTFLPTDPIGTVQPDDILVAYEVEDARQFVDNSASAGSMYGSAPLHRAVHGAPANSGGGGGGGSGGKGFAVTAVHQRRPMVEGGGVLGSGQLLSTPAERASGTPLLLTLPDGATRAQLERKLGRLFVTQLAGAAAGGAAGGGERAGARRRRAADADVSGRGTPSGGGQARSSGSAADGSAPAAADADASAAASERAPGTAELGERTRALAALWRGATLTIGAVDGLPSQRRQLGSLELHEALPSASARLAVHVEWPAPSHPAYAALGAHVAAMSEALPAAFPRESARGAGGGGGKALDLTECLDLHTSPEQLTGDERWYCSKCQTHVDAVKRMELWSTPQVLVIMLKRFHSGRLKNSALVRFPTRGLDLTPYVISHQAKRAAAGDAPPVYDLYAVTNHFGSLHGGHYTAYAKNHVDGEWYLFDDGSARKVGEDEIVTAAAYVLFYERRDVVQRREAVRGHGAAGAGVGSGGLNGGAHGASGAVGAQSWLGRALAAGDDDADAGADAADAAAAAADIDQDRRSDDAHVGGADVQMGEPAAVPPAASEAALSMYG